MPMGVLSALTNLKVSRLFYRRLTMSSFGAFLPHFAPASPAINSGSHLMYKILPRPVLGNIFHTPNKLLLFGINPSVQTVYHIQRCSISTTTFCKSPSKNNQLNNRNRTTLKYIVAIAIFVVGLSYAAVPLYRVFCQASGYGGTVTLTEASEKVENMEAVRERELTIR